VRAQRPVQRQRVAARALLPLRRDHVDFAELLEGAGQGGQARGVNAVIVGDQQQSHPG
jgi:hypothetical protein